MPNRAVLVLVAAKLFLQLSFVEGYGYFRDELYYLACARRVAWGYVDHPPLSVALLAVERAILGESLLAIRILPALAGALVVWLAAYLARELGGGEIEAETSPPRPRSGGRVFARSCVRRARRPRG